MKLREVYTMTLLFSLILLFQACDWFGGNKEPERKTQFNFQLDTLKEITGSFEDLHIFDDTSFVIVGKFHDNNTSPITSFNQIWWGNKRGVYYKSVLTQSLFELVEGNLRFFNGTHLNHVYGGTNAYSTFKNGTYSYYLVSRDIENPLIFTGSTFINENDFYLYGKKGVLGLHKNGVFHRIETNTDLDFTKAVWHGDSLLLYGIQFYDTFKSEQAGLIVVKDTLATSIDRWGYEQENKKPFYTRNVLWEYGKYYFFGQEAIYRYENNAFNSEDIFPMGYGDFETRDEGVFNYYGKLIYYLNSELYEQEIGTEPSTTYINHVAFKGNLMVANTINRYIIIGTR